MSACIAVNHCQVVDNKVYCEKTWKFNTSNSISILLLFKYFHSLTICGLATHKVLQTCNPCRQSDVAIRCCLLLGIGRVLACPLQDTRYDYTQWESVTKLRPINHGLAPADRLCAIPAQSPLLSINTELCTKGTISLFRIPAKQG